ncbi:EamA family transporter [Rhodanobacter sp. Si-c]|uniref:EamA family transporter n=1 Tax=Rhodanobacter lycopersici TaxID=3162487 RepID=A0ABV3QDE7_9GAMM
MSSPAITAALAAALLFGASMPLAKQLLRDVSPMLLAGLLYLGSGVGLVLVRLVRDRGWRLPAMAGREQGWLLLAIVFGGVLGPLLLMLGLARTAAATASLLLNLEAVLTALLAWIVFRENTDRRVMLGMALIVAGVVLLAWPGHLPSAALGQGAPLIALACLCWALDNNITRKVSDSDALFIAGLKGLAAGIVNVALACMLGARLPAAATVAAAMATGLLGYGVSLVLFVLALRGLGAARAGAYFSTAPFLGAVIAIIALGDRATPVFWLAAVLMGAGVWLHLTERHEHLHTHEALTHTHRHVHDEHHQHTHDFDWDGSEPHTHAHIHAPITHSHPHYPDIHHQHKHR